MDDRSDVYSLGVVMYEALAGVLPFTGDTSVAVALKHVNDPPQPLRRHCPDVPDALEALVGCCLEKAIDDRPASASALKAELDRVKLELEFGAAEAGPATTPFLYTTRKLAAARVAAEKRKTAVRRWIEALGRAVLRCRDLFRRPFKREAAALARAGIRHDQLLEQLADLRQSRRGLLDSAADYRKRAEDARQNSAKAFDEDRTDDVDEFTARETRCEQQAIELEKEAHGMEEAVTRLEESYRAAKAEYDQLAEDFEVKKAQWTRLRAERTSQSWRINPLFVGLLTLVLAAVAALLVLRWWMQADAAPVKRASAARPPVASHSAAPTPARVPAAG